MAYSIGIYIHVLEGSWPNKNERCGLTPTQKSHFARLFTFFTFLAVSCHVRFSKALDCQGALVDQGMLGAGNTRTTGQHGNGVENQHDSRCSHTNALQQPSDLSRGQTGRGVDHGAFG